MKNRITNFQNVLFLQTRWDKKTDYVNIKFNFEYYEKDRSH
jgi:hypothetical protein